MLARIRMRYYWPEYLEDVELHLRSCHACLNRGNPQRKRAPLHIYNVGVPFQRVSVDVMGPYRESSEGNRYLVTLLDQFTKWPEVIPVRDVRAETIASALLYNVFCRFGIPLELHTDRAPNMESVLLNEVMKLLGIRHTRTTPLHPSGNPVERLNRTLKEHLTVMIDDRQSDWDRQAQLFLLGYRAMPHAVTGISPCMLMFGRHLTLPADLEYGVPFFEKVEMYSGEYAVRLRETLWELHEIVRQTVRNEFMKTKIRYDAKAKPPDFRPRDVVWPYNPKKVRGLTRKLQTKWEGPYSVVRCLNDLVIQIQKTPNG